MKLPFEQSTILIVDGIIFFAGLIPRAVITRLNERKFSSLEMNLTLVESKILASGPRIS